MTLYRIETDNREDWASANFNVVAKNIKIAYARAKEMTDDKITRIYPVLHIKENEQ